MKARHLTLFLLVSIFNIAAIAQSPDPSQNSGQPPQGRARGQRDGRGAWGGGMMGAGRGVMGVVTEAASDHFTIKTDTGEIYTVHYSVNTHILKGGGGPRRRDENEVPMTPPQPIKASEIKVGDVIGASGEMDANAKSIGAVVIFQIDPERAKQIREMQANYGKTWLIGKVTAINDVKVTLQGGPDNAVHTFVADENTTFRKRRDPITLADIQVGDMVRAEGTVKNGAFVASTVAVMSPPPQRPDQQNGANPLPPQ
jgi:hypothetical protein